MNRIKTWYIANETTSITGLEWPSAQTPNIHWTQKTQRPDTKRMTDSTGHSVYEKKKHISFKSVYIVLDYITYRQHTLF